MSEHVGEAVSHSRNLVTQKIGPLPAYAYALVVIAGVWIFYLVKRNRVSPAALNSETVLSDTGTSSPVENAPSTYTGNATGENGTPAVNSNAVWARTVSNQLVAEGSDPSAVSNAIAKYLSGGALSAQEHALINLALQKFGMPPEGVIPVKVVTPSPVKAPVKAPAKAPVKAPAKPAPKPVAPRKPAQLYTVRSGDSLSAIAHRFYGTYNWQKIYGANKSKIGGNPNLIHPGTTLVIPA